MTCSRIGFEPRKDIRLTTDRMVETMKKTNILWKELAVELRKFNESKKRIDK